MTYNRRLPNVKRAITNNWNLLHINQEFKDVFEEPHILAFKRNRNLYDLLGCKNIIDGKLLRLLKEKKNWMFHKVFLKIGETYALSKFYTQSFKSGAKQKNNRFSMTLTVRVNY